MPERYVKIMNRLIAQGRPVKVAKRIAAATYNKTRQAGELSLAETVARESTRSRARGR